MAEAKSAEAKQGEKMIEVKLRFWTNNISHEPGRSWQSMRGRAVS